MTRFFHRTTLLLVTLMLAGSLSAAAAESDLARIRDSFDEKLEGVLKERDAKIEKLREGYRGALEQLKKSLGKAGDLDGAAQVLGELEAIQDGSDLPELPDDAGRKLSDLREKWDSSLEEIRNDSHEGVSKLHETYSKALTKTRERLTREGRIKEALAYQEELDRAAELPIVQAALKPAAGGSGLGGSVDLKEYLPGKLFSYDRQEAPPRQIQFEERGKAYFLDDEKVKVRWRVKPDERTVLITHRSWPDDVEVVFKADGNSFDGTTVKSERWRRGKLVSEP
ncbi:MAG: hypothetical protein AAGI48_02790 [Verrucomicrobiota bacterium]